LNDTILHSFDGGANGGTPHVAPTISGSVLYGVTSAGGIGNQGVAYKMSIDGSGFQLLHTFTGSTSDGSLPTGALTVSGTKLFGIANNGGAANLGAVYTMNTDGTGFSLLHSFAGGPSDGSLPLGALTLSGSTLYGSTQTGGTSGTGTFPNFGYGTVYKLNTDGTGYTVLHNFDTSAESPGALTLSGTRLFGTTFSAVSNSGTIFSMNTDGTGYVTMHTFPSGGLDGAQPGALTLVGTTLYGVAQSSGSGNYGTLFSMGLDGSNFQVLHSFTSATTDGQTPEGDLVFANGKLYGAASHGGSTSPGTTGGDGAVYSINLDGSGFALEYNFTDNPDGTIPYDLSVAAGGSTLYGVTMEGGTAAKGTVFSVAVPEPATMGLGMMGALLVFARRKRK
jgi:uncharacterized repeat protein (TIGR03803 family)